MKTTVKLRSGESLTIQPSATKQSVQLTIKTIFGTSVGFLIATEDWGVITQAGDIVAAGNIAELAGGCALSAEEKLIAMRALGAGQSGGRAL